MVALFPLNNQGSHAMKIRIVTVLAAAFLPVALAGAAGPKDYQVTGPVLELTNDVITVEKGKEKWEIARTKDTRVTGDLKKGSRVTIHYKMTATSVEVKDAGKGKGDAKAETKGEGKAKGEAKAADAKSK
jgi:hypothetical protein